VRGGDLAVFTHHRPPPRPWPPWRSDRPAA
jgi:hypothetical protein